MKKQIFWKTIVSLIVVWLFLFLWMNQWHYFAEGLLKTSNITGKIYLIHEGKWIDIDSGKERRGKWIDIDSGKERP